MIDPLLSSVHLGHDVAEFLASMNLLLQAGLILCRNTAIVISKLSSTIFICWTFLICTMLIIQGLFYKWNQTVLFSAWGRSHKEGLIYASTLGCRDSIASTSGFAGEQARKNAAYRELSDHLYKPAHVLMSV